MSKKFLSILLFFCLAFYLSAQNFWIKTNYPGGDQISSPRSIAVDNYNHLYLGTYASGIFKSTDRGENWTKIFDGGWHKKLIYDFASNSIYSLVISNDAGIFNSTNNGLSWSKLSNFPVNHYGVNDLYIDKSGNLYLCFNYADQQGGVFLSTNQGQNWTNILGNAENYYSIVKTANNRIIVASTGKIYYSDNNGLSWSNISFPVTFTPSKLVIDKSGNVYLATLGYGIYKSTNNGSSWSLCKEVGWEFYDLYADNDGNLYAGCDNYVYRSTDSGGSWELLNSGLNNDKYIKCIAASLDGYIYCGADYGYFYRSSLKVVNVENEKQDAQEISSFEIFQNYPNPFNSLTTVSFLLPEAGNVTIKIYDTNGKIIKNEVLKNLSSGYQSFKLDLNDQPGGIYFIQFFYNKKIKNLKLILLK